MPAQGEDIGSGWFRYWDETEESYYYHHTAKGETSWELPPECESAHPEGQAAGVAVASQSAGGEGGEPSSEAAPAESEADNAASADPATAAATEGASAGEAADHPLASDGSASASQAEGSGVGDKQEGGDTSSPSYDWEAYAKANGYASAHAAYKAYSDYYYSASAPQQLEWQWGPQGWYQGPPRPPSMSTAPPPPAPYAPTGPAGVGGGNYDWGAYAAANGYASGQEAYAAYYGQQGGHAGGGQYAAAVPARGGSGGGMIYEPNMRGAGGGGGGGGGGRGGGGGGGGGGESAAARLERILGGKIEAPEGDAEEEGAKGGLTEAQKIFGTGETFTIHAGLQTTAGGEGAAVELGPEAMQGERGEGRITAEDIAASARELQERALEAGGPIKIDINDAKRHGSVAQGLARETILLNAVNATSTGADPDVFKASFNRKTGRFEGAGQVLKMSVNDHRRQTSHFFDYDKWAQEKASQGPTSKKKPKLTQD